MIYSEAVPGLQAASPHVALLASKIIESFD